MLRSLRVSERLAYGSRPAYLPLGLGRMVGRDAHAFQILQASEWQPMEFSNQSFLRRHRTLTRRYFLGLGAAGVAAWQSSPLFANDAADSDTDQDAIKQLEPWVTRQDDFQDVSRGNPKPHTLNDEQRAAVGLTRETWKLEVIADPDSPADLRTPLSASLGNAFDFAQLMEMAETRSVRFAKVMTCLNIGCPLGNGIWEGVPMRDVLWKTQPQKDLRRVIYFGYHNDQPDQMFRSSLPVGRVLEDPFGLPPVILCYKLNGEYLSPKRGGPVRVVVPEAYGFKSIKWLTHLYLSNRPAANDTYAEKNNDVDSPLKTFCETLSIAKQVKSSEPIAVTGYAQVGISGLKKVQVSVQSEDDKVPKDDEYLQTLNWIDANILPPPDDWGDGLLDPGLLKRTMGFDAETGHPNEWPIRFSKAHWAALLPGLTPGRYLFRCRTIDENGNGQPLPRPFRKSGRAHIEQVSLEVTA